MSPPVTGKIGDAETETPLHFIQILLQAGSVITSLQSQPEGKGFEVGTDLGNIQVLLITEGFNIGP